MAPYVRSMRALIQLAAPGALALALAALVQVGTTTIGAQLSPTTAAEAPVPTLAVP